MRWRDGTRNRARTFDRKADAVVFETEVRRRRVAGDLELVLQWRAVGMDETSVLIPAERLHSAPAPRPLWDVE